MLTLTSLHDGDLRIDHADPRVVFSGKLIDSIIDNPSGWIFVEPSGHFGIIGSLLKIKGANQQVVYRLTEWLPSIRAYIGERPE